MLIRLRYCPRIILGMIFLILLFAEIAMLFLLSRTMSKTLSGFLSINLLSLVFLPGIIIHELAHLFMATILFVPVGEMEFVPRKSAHGAKLGSVEIADTDPIRRAMIGFAPVFAGIALIVGAVYFFSSNILFFQNNNPYVFIAVSLALVYLLFAVSNTMFSSSKDMEGTVEILITLLIIFGAAYILGFRSPLAYLEKILTKEFFGIIQKSTIFLLAPIILDLSILGIIKLFTGSRNQRF